MGLPFDIHGGGGDLIFPHHENERAQSEAACGCTFAEHWMHAGMLRINSEKMSKSLGNFKLLRDVLQTTEPAVLRFLMLQTHYRSPLDFSDERLEEANSALCRIRNTVRNLDWLLSTAADGPATIDSAALQADVLAMRAEFIAGMDDDFNTCKAAGEICKLVSSLNAHLGDATISTADVAAITEARDTIVELMGVLGVGGTCSDDGACETALWPDGVLELAKEQAGYEGANKREAVDALLSARAEARKAKDWGRADAVRDGLAGMGFTIEDTPQGARVTFGG